MCGIYFVTKLIRQAKGIDLLSRGSVQVSIKVSVWEVKQPTIKMASQPQSTLLPSAPPAYSEKQQLQQQVASAQQNQVYQQGPGLQAWPQGYLVGTQCH